MVIVPDEIAETGAMMPFRSGLVALRKHPAGRPIETIKHKSFRCRLELKNDKLKFFVLSIRLKLIKQVC